MDGNSVIKRGVKYSLRKMIACEFLEGFINERAREEHDVSSVARHESYEGISGTAGR